MWLIRAYVSPRSTRGIRCPRDEDNPSTKPWNSHFHKAQLGLILVLAQPFMDAYGVLLNSRDYNVDVIEQGLEANRASESGLRVTDSGCTDALLISEYSGGVNPTSCPNIVRGHPPLIRPDC